MYIPFDESLLFRGYPFQQKTPATLIDVGANVGTYATTFAKIGWHVVVFEPETKLFKQLQANTRMFPNITYIKKAVTEVTGDVVDFFTSDIHNGIHTLKPFHSTHKATLEVETTRLDDALKSLSIPPVAMIKIDVEGADFGVLKSFDFTQHQPEIVMCEFMDSRTVPNFGYNYHDMVLYMQTCGYVTFVSEWTEITRYSTPDAPNTSKFVRCQRYPLDSEPAWGNLIFVIANRAAYFENYLKNYLQQQQRQAQIKRVRNIVKRVPGLQHLYRLLRSLRA